MSAGTITLTNGSAVVGGTGTSFSTEIAAGDFIVSTVGGVSYTLPVKSVESNAQLTLVSNFTGPTQAGAAWSAVPRVALNMVTAALVAQSAEALRGLNYDKQNWQRIFTGTGDVPVILPDGTTWTGPAWNSITTSLSGKAEKGANSDITSLSGLTTALSVSQGGTGSTTASGARKNLGLGTSSLLDAGTSSGNVMKVGAFGLGGQAIFLNDADISSPISGSQLFMYGGQGFWGSWGAGLKLNYGGSYNFQIYLQGTNGTLATLVQQTGGITKIRSHYNDGNTTVASDGSLKVASPVARVVKNPEACERKDIAETGFSWCGCGTSNEEAEGINILRLDVGVYKIIGSDGLASKGWQLLPPMDPGGMGELGIVEAEQTDNGELTIRLFKRKYMLGDEGEIVKTKGEPIDVPANSWIDVRLDMPESSIWNRHRKQEIEADNQIPGS